MKVVFFANNIRGLRCLETLLQNNKSVVALVLHPDPDNELLGLAHRFNIPVFHPQNINDSEFSNILKSLEADLFILCGYNRILKRHIITIPKLGTINLHGGKLPGYRGRAPINWQIINGENTGGCSILFVDKGIDTGDIIAQEFYPIALEDDAAAVLDKTLRIFPPLLLRVVDLFEKGDVPRTRQSLDKGCYYTRRYPKDGLIKWHEMEAVQIYNLVRALVPPYPGAFTFYDGKKIYVTKTKLLSEDIIGVPGRIALFRDKGVVVIARDRGLLIESVGLIDNGNEINARQVLITLGEDLE